MVLGFVRRAAQRTAHSVTRQTAAQLRREPIVADARFLTARFSTTTSASGNAMARRPPQPPTSAFRAEHYKGDVATVLAGVAVVSALIGVGQMWWNASSPSTGSGRKAAPAPGVLQDISRDEIARFFEELKASIQELFNQLPQIDAAFREHLKTQKIELGEDEYKQTLLQQLFDVLQNIEQQVIGARGWNRESFARALEQFADDEEINQLQKELQVIMHSVFPPPEIPAELTPEKTLEMLSVLVQGMEHAMAEMLRHARAEGITDPKVAMEEFQQVYLDQVEQLTFELMKKHNVASEMYNVALQKYFGENPEFRSKVEALYAKQAEAFRRMGLDVEDNAA